MFDIVNICCCLILGLMLVSLSLVDFGFSVFVYV